MSTGSLNSLAGFGIFGLVVGSAALADPLTVSTAQTTAVSTAAASNGSAGDVTVASGGSIVVADVGPALTVNSSNNATIAGTVQSSATTGATAILVDSRGGVIGTTVTNNGTVGITGAAGSGNYGIRVIGSGMTGSIASGSASTLSVLGDSSYGLSVEAPITGNVAIGGVTVTGANSVGVAIAAPLSGSLTLSGVGAASGLASRGVLTTAAIGGGIVNNSSLSPGAASTTTTASDGTSVAVPAAAATAGIDIAASVGGGFLNNRYYVDANGALVADAAATSSDTLVTGIVAGISGSTAVLVAPLAANGQDILLSPVGTVGTDDGYGFVNRGTLSSTGSVSGISSTAVRIAGASAPGLNSNVVISQGLINQANGLISSSAVDAGTTALSIGARATVPTIVNKGVISANVSLAAMGGTGFAHAIAIDPGSQVGSLVNSGAIGSTLSGGNGESTAILDRSGNLATIANSGTISALGAGARAIDLSAGSGPETVANSGAITGDIVFGTGNAVYSATSGTLAGMLGYGSGTNRLSLDGSSLFDGAVTVATGGTLSVTTGGTSSLNFGATPPRLASFTASGQSQLTLPVAGAVLAVDGVASFQDQSSIKLVIGRAVGSAPITLITAGGGIATDHLPTLISGTTVPFLYSLSGFDISGGALQVTLHQKTGSEVGFGSGVAPLFDQSITALGSGSTFQAIANLPDQSALFAAYRQILPPNFGTLPVRLAQDLQGAGSGVVRGRLDALAANPPGSSTDEGKLSPWIEESASLLRHGDSPDDPGFRSNNFDLSLGADYALSKALAIGVAGTFAWDSIHIDGETSVSNKPFSADSLMGDVYAGWHSKLFFAQLVGSYAHNHYAFDRQIDIATVSLAQSARWNGYQLSGDLVGGMRLHIGRFRIEPSDALSYIKLHQGGYTTSGGDVLDLTVNGKNDKAALNTARMGLGYSIPIGDEGAIDLSARAAYVAQLDHQVSPLTAAFVSGGSPFEMATVAYHDNSFQEGASVAYRAPGFYVGLNADRRQEKLFSDTSIAVTLRTAL